MAVRHLCVGCLGWGNAVKPFICFEVVVKIDLIGDEGPEAEVAFEAAETNGIYLKG